MRSLIVLCLLASCGQSQPINESDYAISDGLRYCDTNDHTPKAPPAIRTDKALAGFAVMLELSREALIKARNECDIKRATAVEMLDNLKAKEDLK